MKNTQAKTRPVDNPYEIWVGKLNFMGEWLDVEWRVLKKWQYDDNKLGARWLCAVKSQATFGSWEYGDTYVSDIKANGVKVYDERDK